MLGQKLLMRMGKAIKGIFIGSDNLPPVIATSTAATATAYSNQRKLDRTSNGVLWTIWFQSNTLFGLAYSVDEGVTWISAGTILSNIPGTTNSFTPNCSFFIDQDDYAHLVHKDQGNGFIYYRRGTPNAGRTAWTWSAATTIYSGSSGHDYPDIIAHREGTGWRVHIVTSRGDGTTTTTNNVFYGRLAVSSTGIITSDISYDSIGTGYSIAAHKYPSIDFNHTGDGKTVANGTPHLYVAWSAGATGAGKGIRFKKATYNAGAWTWGTEREIDSTRYILNYAYWLNCFFDGTRVIFCGMVYDGTNNDLVLHERDISDTTTTSRVLLDNPSNTEWLGYAGSSSYDSSGNVYLFGANGNETAGNRDLVYRKWTRSDTTLGPEVVVDSSVSDPYVSAKRGYSGGRIEFIYTDGTASPYSIKYSYVGGPVELYPAQITTSTAATATAYSNQRKVDRTSNGVLWSLFNRYSSSRSAGDLFYSLDEGVTWLYEGFVTNGSDVVANTYTPNTSFFIDQDDYAHVVFKDQSNGFIYYRRGTPNAARTSWTWSAATQVYSSTSGNYPDIIAHREGSGWVAHIVSSYTNASTNEAMYWKINITSSGVISVTGPEQLAGSTTKYGNGNATYPSIDFNHTGDGKTVKGGTPHLYVAWSAGATGAGKGIRFKKATYSGGSWTWGTEREIDSTRYVPNDSHWLTCMFDGTRVVIPGALYTGSVEDLVLYERDAGDSATTTRVLLANATPNYVFSGSATYDAAGNVYMFGRDGNGTSTTRPKVYRKWDRATATLGGAVSVGSPGTGTPWFSAKRGYSGAKVEFIYTDGTASPYPIMYGAIV